MKRLLTVILLLSVLAQLVLLPAQAAELKSYQEATALTEDKELRQQIEYLYQASLEYAEKSSFDGYCAFYVNTQLYLLKINRQYVAGNGKDEFDNYRYKSQSNGGYHIAAYPAGKYSLSGALNAICENGSKRVYNILVGFEKGVSTAGRKYGHTCFIHAIIDGKIYFSDSQKVTIDGVDYPEGSAVVATVEQFSSFYSRWTLDGLIHFTYPEDDHVCNRDTSLFQITAHPHRRCYQCGICGRIWKDTEASAYFDDCHDCNYPGTPALHLPNSAYYEGDTLAFTWEETSLTTGYRLIIEMADGGGAYHLCASYDTSALELTIPAVAGQCRAKLRAINADGHLLGSTDAAYADSAWIYFFVDEPWDCALRGHVYEETGRQDSTCTEEGTAWCTCKFCGADTTKTVYPMGHRFDTGTILTEPEAEQEGTIEYRCVNCEETHLAALPHESSTPFADLSRNDYYYVGAVWAYNAGITTGITDSSFAPTDTATRAQVVTFLWRAAGCPEPAATAEEQPFVDVDWNDYYATALLWAIENGITSGMSAHHFGPDAPVTRAQFVTFLYRMAGQPETQCGATFADTGLGEYYDDAVVWAVRSSITSGMSKSKFRPYDPCTRGQIVTFLYRFYHWL